MGISFNQIPVNLLTPGQYVEFDNSKAAKGLVNMPQRILLLAPMLETGTLVPNAPAQVSSASEGMVLFGRGSIGAQMIAAIFSVTDTIETWVVGIPDSGAGSAAAGTVTVTGSPIESGPINLYIAGRRIQVGVSPVDTATTIAEALADAINADLDGVVTADSDAAVVTLTCRHEGTLGNDIDLRINYYPLSEATPKGIGIAITAFSGGTGDASVATALANIGDRQYNTIITATSTQSDVALIETELDSRWGPLRQNDGHCHIGLRGTVGTINAYLSSRNNPHVTFWTAESGGEPGPIWEKAALAGTVSAYYLGIDPARPLQTLVLPGRLPATADKQFTRAERNNILSYGGATTTVDAGGNVCVERAVTSYTLNQYGLVDPSYRDIETMYTLSLLRYQVRARIAQRFPRYKLADDGTQFPPGQTVVTPKIIRAELIALALDWIDAGLVENIEQFKTDLLVERNTTDVNRVDVLLPPDLVNQFRVFAAQLQFRL
ncbi:MAG: phage tail sheath subtilisin-like domain-containing protein [Burkholderiaceae bacterium]|jgi:phage tail sheath gpL-like|nr:phage tail sheath subtilisin-like domain-containing protein [Burkholderiaceae bacterium]